MTQAQLLSIVLLVGIAPITGSFMGVLVHRIPAGRKVGLDRSACDACGHVLGIVDLLPVVNWVVSLGRCRYCGVKVSAFYPLIELAALGVVLWAWTVASGWQLWTTSILGWTLLVLALINLEHFTLPARLTAPVAALGLAVAWLAAPDALADQLTGLATGLGLGIALTLFDGLSGRRFGLGRGAVLMFALAGVWLGWQGLADLVIAALGLAAVATVMGRGHLAWAGRIPGGACVALALWLVWLYGPFVAG